MVQHIDRRMVLLSARDARALATTIIEADMRLGSGVHAPIRKIAYDILAGLPSASSKSEVSSPPVTDTEVCGADVVGTAEAARILDMTPRRVCQLADEGDLPSLPGREPGQNWKFRREDVEVFRDYRE